jgi:hypothetical protein
MSAMQTANENAAKKREAEFALVTSAASAAAMAAEDAMNIAKNEANAKRVKEEEEKALADKQREADNAMTAARSAATASAMASAEQQEEKARNDAARANLEAESKETAAISIANSAAIAAAMVAIENAKKPIVAPENTSAAAAVVTTPETKPMVEETVTETVRETAIDENDRIMAIATAVAANKSAAPTVTATTPIVAPTVTATAPIAPPTDSAIISAVAATVPTDKVVVTKNVSNSPKPTPDAVNHTKKINGLLVLIAHILKQKSTLGSAEDDFKDDKQIVPKPTEIPSIETPSAKPAAKPPTNVDLVKYNKAVKDFKNAIITKYPRVDNKSISISPVAIEKDTTNTDKYILFASFDVNGINKTEYAAMNI